MTVYVLACIPAWEIGSVDGVFSTKEKAQAYLEKILANGSAFGVRDQYEITEWIVDEC